MTTSKKVFQGNLDSSTRKYFSITVPAKKKIPLKDSVFSAGKIMIKVTYNNIFWEKLTVYSGNSTMPLWNIYEVHLGEKKFKFTDRKQNNKL